MSTVAQHSSTRTDDASRWTTTNACESKLVRSFSYSFEESGEKLQFKDSSNNRIFAYNKTNNNKSLLDNEDIELDDEDDQYYFGSWNVNGYLHMSKSVDDLNRLRKTDTGSWDDRTSTLTFHTFRPKSPAELVPVSGVTHQMLNGTYDRRKIKGAGGPDPTYYHGNEYACLNIANGGNNHLTSIPASPKAGVVNQHLYYYQTPTQINDGNVSPILDCVDIIVNVSLKQHENRVGFSMSGGQDHLPTVINNVLESSPADRAGLCPGDEILEINGLSMLNASYNEIIQHIHQCIKSRNIQLKIRRKPENQIVEDSAPDFVGHSQLSNGNFYTAEAYMVSVDENHKPELTDKLRTFHPNIKISDMERMTSSATTVAESTTSNHYGYKNGHVTHYNNSAVVVDEEGEEELETSFVNNDKNLQSQRSQQSQKSQPISVGQYYGSRTSLKNVNNTATSFNNGTTVAPVHNGTGNNGNHNFNGNNGGDYSPSGQSFSNNKTSSVVDNDHSERLKRYDLDLRKRREAEDKQAKEEEFLRSSLRGSKKLQALEQGDREHSSSCHENIGFLDDDHYSENGGFEDIHGNPSMDRPIALEDVLMSVNRLTEVLDQMPEHQRDSQFIRDLFSDRVVQNAIEVTAVSRVHFSDRDKLTPMSKSSFQDSETILKQLGDSVSDKAGDLQTILEKPHVRGMLYAHDKIAEKLPEMEPSTSFAGLPSINSYNKDVMGLKETRLEDGMDNFRIIKLFKDGDHPLGATVKNDGEAIIIGRVVKGGVAEKSGLLKEGDEILEVNGADVRGKTVHEVCDLLANLSGEISFVVVPAPPETIVDGPPHTVVKHVRALYNYDPEDDIYLPCRELGLHFGKGDILHVISMTDANWWQALRDGEENVHQLAGLIPSASLQTQKEQYNREVKAEVDKENDDSNVGGFLCTKRKKPKRNNQLISKSTIKDKSSIVAPPPVNNDDDDIPTYEEVSLYLSPTGRRRPVVLVGPLHVGCLELRQKLMETEKDKFAGVVPHTSRPRRVDEQDGVHYYFVTKQQFQEDVNCRQFVEWGEYQKHFYGTSFDSIKRVVDRGKTCVLTLKAQNLKGLRNSDFMPFVVFVSPPSFERLKFNKQRAGEKDLKEDELRSIIMEAKETEEKYGHLFDKVLVNFDLDRTFQELRMAIHRLETEPQWVPSGWLKNPNTSLSR